MILKELLADVPVLHFNGNREEEIQEISYSSKKIKPGSLFAALKGEKSDGFQFIEEAISEGAVAILSERSMPRNLDENWIQVSDARAALALCSANLYSHPSQKMKVVGITGTKGKTTVTYLMEEIVKKANFQPGVIGTISYRGWDTEIKADRTTPEAPDLQRMLREMLDKGTTYCLMEVSSHSLVLKRTVGIGFDTVVLTNLSGEHLDYHITMESYFEAKKLLFSLGKKNCVAVINADDSWGKKLISQLPIEKITFGLDPSAVVHCEKFKFKADGIDLVVKYPAGELWISAPLLGKPNLYNILAAISAALTLNISPSAIKAGIASLRGVPGRFEKVENSQGLNIFVDYAHTDDALKNLLKTIRELSPNRIILVFGAGGDRDRTKRSRMGEIAGKLADWTIITSDNPRSENPLDIISDIEKGVNETGAKKYEIQPDRREAIKRALSLAKKGEYILIAGKGHEDYQIIGDKVFPFKDSEVIKAILKEMETN